MARPKKDKPDYCRDKSSGRAFVTLRGERKYLGNWNTRESRDEYDRVIGEWIAAGRQKDPDKDEDQVITIGSVIAAFWSHATTYYASCILPDGKVTGELDNYRLALKPLRRLYGDKPVAKFGPLALKSLRDEMVRLKWCRNYINRQVLRIKSVWPEAALGPGSCFASFLAETRSSQSPTATLSDYVIGSFNTCRLDMPNTATVQADGLTPLTSNKVILTILDGDEAIV